MDTTTATFENRNRILEHSIVSQEKWLQRRKELLSKEKELTRLRDRLNAERRELPWVPVEKNYLFDAPGGKVSLKELFAGRSQLVIYHFMFGPDWNEGCPSCSFVSDHIDGALPHLAARDATMVMVSRAPLAKIEAFKKRMGWRFTWVSSYGSDFNSDFRVSFTKDEMAQGKVNYNYAMQEFPSEEAPGISVFYQDAGGDVFHTYSSYGRGLEQLVGTYMILDMVPKGRDEDKLGFTMEWVRHHDRYGTDEFADPTKPYWPATESPSSTTCSCGSAETGS
ncbi:MAG TPA: thioredoxin family protein [Chthoniobacterales bacterium]|nr:thioredoxin family protein [Chthoniobacterales bacterium]